MATAKERMRADAIVQVRMPNRTKDLISAAAAAEGKTLSTFLIESASGRASDVLLDQRIFDLDDVATAEFLRVLEEPSRPSEALVALARRPARAWDVERH
jgi:uncharacterized protein (DUF1778 family)